LNVAFKETLQSGLKSYKNYKFGLIINIIDTKTNQNKYKRYYINPLNLK